MSNKIFLLAFVTIAGINATPLFSQTTSASSYFSVQPASDRTVIFNVADPGVSKPIIWGLDLAWLSESNIRRGIAFMSPRKVDVVRASFQPTYPLVNGDLQTAQIDSLNIRLNLIDLTGTETKVALNCDHPRVDSWYIGNAANWAQLIDVTTRRVQERGRTVVSVAPFNEPDFGWGQYSGSKSNGMSDFKNIAGELRKNPRFDNIRISGGNTLNCDEALSWYNYLKDRLEEGNTHQLAGSFDNYANFHKSVAANGDHGTNDELHNVMEAMVGVEYGMKTGIWWGTAEYARGEFVKASDGVRLGYAEHRPNWTAASVYRSPDGKIQAFGGTSERQAATTTYRFFSKTKDVYFDGYGPQREYTMVLPGGTGYQKGQTNAERVMNITWGDDIQPVINGRYVLVNRNSGKVMEVTFGSTSSGANVWQNSFIPDATYQQWNVTPVDSRIGGDFSYFTITSVKSSKSLDIYNWSLDNTGNIVQWDVANGANQQWYLEYAEDGWFYIRSRHSAKCIEVANASMTNGANVYQWEKDGDRNQQWRFIPVGAPVEFVSPAAPASLTATPNAESVKLEWTASADTDVAGYNIYRKDSPEGKFETIARNIKNTSFVDNTTTENGQYFYAVRAVDNSLNRSVYSNEASAITTGANDLVASLQFENNISDSTVNLNHAASSGSISYTTGKTGANAISLNGTNAFLQLPPNIANQQEITIAAWVYCRGGTVAQRIFDFGNSQNEYMYLTPNNGNGQLRFGIKNGGDEQQLNATSLAGSKWIHVAVTLATDTARLYVNGIKVSESNTMTIKPLDFKPALNYIGRSQFSYPLFNGNIDDFRVYNYALTPEGIAEIAGILSGVEDLKSVSRQAISIFPVPAEKVLNIKFNEKISAEKSEISVLDVSGNIHFSQRLTEYDNVSLDVSDFPSGIYILKLSAGSEIFVKKFVVNH
ncbi:MAG TPA: RICIN domain-containing protein [Paludibacteraceae bacterium]|nr:RICIN domain-containing protein [Paludibacteraceae bacterium]